MTVLANESLASLLDHLYDPVLVIHPKSGRILIANKAAQDFLGYSGPELGGLTPSDIHPHEIPRLERFLQDVSANGRWRADDLSCRTKSGNRIPAEVRATVVHLEDEMYILSIVRDRREERLAQLGQSMRKLTHDLRNTLATALLLTDRLVEYDDPAVARSAATITRSIERAVEMCRTTLRAGHAREAVPTPERFLMKDLIEDVRAAIGDTEVSGLQIHDECREDFSLDADFEQIYRIFVNLARNAMDAGASELRIRGVELAEETVIDISDDGPGVPDAVRDNLSAEKPELSLTEGSGLGLAIASELAQNHGGSITIASSNERGTVFRLRLPRPQW